MTPVAALTGTPGTGKSTLASLMTLAGWRVVDLTELALRSGAVVGRDEARGTDEVEVGILQRAVRELLAVEEEGERTLLVGHMAHLMPCDVVAVLRCSPGVLRERLSARGWPDQKVEENTEAEAVGVVLTEAMEREPPVPVYELDTTQGPPERTAEQLKDVLDGGVSRLEGGWVDWSEEVMGWY